MATVQLPRYQRQVRGSVGTLQKDVKATQDQQASLGKQTTDLSGKLTALSSRVDTVDRSLSALRDKVDHYIVAHP